jgi:hypothetical protein
MSAAFHEAAERVKADLDRASLQVQAQLDRINRVSPQATTALASAAALSTDDDDWSCDDPNAILDLTFGPDSSDSEVDPSDAPTLSPNRARVRTASVRAASSPTSPSLGTHRRLSPVPATTASYRVMTGVVSTSEATASAVRAMRASSGSADIADNSVAPISCTPLFRASSPLLASALAVARSLPTTPVEDVSPIRVRTAPMSWSSSPPTDDGDRKSDTADVDGADDVDSCSKSDAEDGEDQVVMPVWNVLPGAITLRSSPPRLSWPAGSGDDADNDQTSASGVASSTDDGDRESMPSSSDGDDVSTIPRVRFAAQPRLHTYPPPPATSVSAAAVAAFAAALSPPPQAHTPISVTPMISSAVVKAMGVSGLHGSPAADPIPLSATDAGTAVVSPPRHTRTPSSSSVYTFDVPLGRSPSIPTPAVDSATPTPTNTAVAVSSPSASLPSASQYLREWRRAAGRADDGDEEVGGDVDVVPSASLWSRGQKALLAPTFQFRTLVSDQVGAAHLSGDAASEDADEVEQALSRHSRPLSSPKSPKMELAANLTSAAVELVRTIRT